MSLTKKPEEKGSSKVLVGRKPKLEGVGGTSAPDMVADIARSATSLNEIADRVKDEYGVALTIPSISDYLRKAWGDDYEKNKKEMSERRSNRKRWEKEFELARQNIGESFKKDYLSTDDGVYFDFENETISELPSLEDRAYRQKNVINYSEPKDFGWSQDKKNPDANGTVDKSVMGVIFRQLDRRIDGLIEDKKKRFVKKKVEEELQKINLDESNEDYGKLTKDMARKVRREHVEELKELDAEKSRMLLHVIEQLQDGDNRSKLTHNKDLLREDLCPAFASSDKSDRGKQRMLSLPNETFSRAVQNLPYVLYMHPKRLQVQSHNLAKKLPELLNSEAPIVKARYNDIPGINGRVRFPKDVEEHVKTQEAGMLISEDFANKFKYFMVVEEGTVIGENINDLPNAPRVAEPIKTYADYVRSKGRVKEGMHVDRLDPIVLGGFEDIGYGVGNRQARHSGDLVLVGPATQRSRKITLAQGEEGDDVVALDYWTQDYQIVRTDILRVGDKILDRGGLKGIISDIKKDLGKDEKGRPYDLIVNYDEVWRETDRKTEEDKIKDDTYHRQGKKKSAIVLEHEAADGKIFFFMIDKFAQDSTTVGLSFSPTLVSGLWERALDSLPKGATEFDRNEIINHFAERYFRGEGNFVPTLKALHYKAVKKDGIVTITVDDREPTPDEYGEVVDLPHTYAGNTYQKAYVPHYISRVYFDEKGKTFREIYIEQQGKIPSDDSDAYWFNITKQVKKRFKLFPREDIGIQLVTRPWCEDPKDPTKHQKVQMDYMDVIDMGADYNDPNLVVTFRKEPVTTGDSIQTHPVDVDKTGKFRGSIGLNPTLALKATIDYDGDTVMVFTPPIPDAISTLDDEALTKLKSLKIKKFNEQFENLYDKAKKVKYGTSEEKLGISAARYNQETAEAESDMIERLGGLRKRSLILQGVNEPPTVIIGAGTKYEEPVQLTMDVINMVTDVEKILKMKEPRWLLKEIQKKPIDTLTKEEWSLARDYYIRKELTRVVNVAIKDPGVKKLYGMLKQPSEYMREEFTSKVADSDPIGMRLDTKNRLLDRILFNEVRESDIFVDLDE